MKTRDVNNRISLTETTQRTVFWFSNKRNQTVDLLFALRQKNSSHFLF